MEQQILISCKSCRRQYDATGMRSGEHLRCRCGHLMAVPDELPHEARMVHCSSCGGKLAPGMARCEYCGGEVALEDRMIGPACPLCFARLRPGARFCMECGARIQPQALRGIRSSARCPRCKGSLVLRELENGQYTECTSCGGIWLDAQHFERVLQEKDAGSLGHVLPAATCPGTSGEAKTPEVVPDTVKYIPCPVCGTLMHRKNFAGCSGVILDWCKGHGFWFDTYELAKVLEFIRAGGLDRSRRLEIERAKSEIRQLEDKKNAMSAKGSGWTLDRGADTSWGVDVGDVLSMLLRGLTRSL